MLPRRASLRVAIGSLLASSSASLVAASADYIHVDGFEAATDCSAVLACPVPPAGKTCISGQLTSAGTGAPLRAFFNAGLTCAGGAIGGPCDLTLTAYDALSFAQDPVGSTPLPFAEKTVDGCGRFRFAGLDAPTFGSVMIVTDDASPPDDLFAPAGTPHALAPNARVDGVNVIAARKDTVVFWTTSAGEPFGGGSTFVDQGTVLLQFSAGGIPPAGVTATLNGSAVALKDYYFSDAAPARLHVDSGQLSTGADGAALIANGGLGSYSGAGGEPMGCTWPQRQSTSVPGVLVFVEIGC